MERNPTLLCCAHFNGLQLEFSHLLPTLDYQYQKDHIDGNYGQSQFKPQYY